MWYNKFVVKIPTILEIKKAEKNLFKANKYARQELRKISKKQQKMIKIKPKNAILMSEKISVTLINKGFSRKYGVKVGYPLKQGLKLNFSTTISNIS